LIQRWHGSANTDAPLPYLAFFFKLDMAIVREVVHSEEFRVRAPSGAVAGMALGQRSTLHHHFRNLTAMSPLQFQKQLRLQAARRKMLTDELDAASAAFEVGYESPSQFSREYKRFFGKPPVRDIQALKESA
jgi:transcriptional regulator GlxA family with amidase domain